MRTNKVNPIIDLIQNEEGKTVAAVRKTQNGYLACLNRSMLKNNAAHRVECQTRKEAQETARKLAQETFGGKLVILAA